MPGTVGAPPTGISPPLSTDTRGPNNPAAIDLQEQQQQQQQQQQLPQQQQQQSHRFLRPLSDYDLRRDDHHMESSFSQPSEYYDDDGAPPHPILVDFVKDLARAKPGDVTQFGADWFNRALAVERKAFVGPPVLDQNNMPSQPAPAHHPTPPPQQPQRYHFQPMMTENYQISHQPYSTTHPFEPSNTHTGVGTLPRPQQRHQIHQESPQLHVQARGMIPQGVAHMDTDFASPFLPEDTESTLDLDDDSSSDSGSPPPPPPAARARRESVSAESMAPNAAGEAWEKIVIPKSEDQKSRIAASVAQNFLFKRLDEEQYVDVVNAMTEKRFSPKDIVIKQGAAGDYFYVVEKGELDCFIEKNGETTKKMSYSSGGSFGELALMYNARRAATITAVTDCLLWALDRVTFRKILMENTSRKRRMYESFLDEVPLLSTLEPYERFKIADALDSVTFETGETIVRQGEMGDKFFIIEDGKAVVKKRGREGVEQTVNSLKKGDYFGELALLGDRPRFATVQAETRLKAVSMNKRAFTRLLGPLGDLMRRNIVHYERLPGEELDPRPVVGGVGADDGLHHGS